MEKAYDPKALALRLKARGIDVVEEAGKIVVEEIFAWLDESAKLSPMSYDDLASAAVYPKLKELALKAVDKLDGSSG